MLGVLPGLLGVIQATETIKLLLGVGDPLVGRLLLVDVLCDALPRDQACRNPACAVCGEQPTVRRLIDYDAFCAGAGAAQAPVPALISFPGCSRECRR